MVRKQRLSSGSSACNASLTVYRSFKVLCDTVKGIFVHNVFAVWLDVTPFAAQRVDRGPELAAYGVVDKKVAGGVDVAEQLRATGHESERVVIATAQTDVRDEQDGGPKDHPGNSAHGEQNGAANQHPRQSYVTHGHGGRRRLFSPRRHLVEFDDGDDGGDKDNNEESSWER